jgi:hypothetical protein
MQVDDLSEQPPLCPRWVMRASVTGRCTRPASTLDNQDRVELTLGVKAMPESSHLQSSLVT